MRKRLFIAVILSMAMAAFAVPNLFDYQGKLTDVSGVGVNDTLDMIVRIYDDPSAGTLLDQDTLEDVPVVKGLFDLQYEVDLTLPDLTGDLYLELTVDGHVLLPRMQIAAVPFALTAQYVDSAYHAVKADSLGGHSAADLMPNDLQGAYDLGEDIVVSDGTPVDIRTSLTDASDRAVEIRTKDDVEPALYVYNAGSGPAIFCSGDLRMNGEIWSNADLKMHIDKNVSATDNKFSVVNDTGVTVFSVDEHGDAMILGELDPKAVTFMPQAAAPTGATGKVYYDEADSSLKWFDGTAWQDFGGGGGPSSGDVIWNQDSAAQSADFWIDGQGIVGGITSFSDEEVVIGTGTGTSTFRPIAGYWRYHREVSRISAAEIGAGGACTIDTISIYLGDLSTTDPWTYDSVYVWAMLLPAGAAMPTTWDVSHATLLFNDNAFVVPQTATGWVPFDITDLAYDGTSDLFIFIQNGYQGTNYGSDAPGFAYTTVASGNYAYGSSDGSWPTSLYSSTSRPNFRLSITGYPSVVDRVTIQNGNIDADNDVEAGSFTLDGETITSWPDFITRLDTITATDHDTVVVDEALKVMGELIADSIQADGDIIYLDDNIEVAGCALFGGGVAPFDVLYAQSFDGGSDPVDWTQSHAEGSGAVTYETSTSHPSGYLPTDGTHLVEFNSYSYSTGDSVWLEQTTGFSTVGYTNITVAFDFLHHNSSYYTDSVIVRYSLDGATWSDLGSFVNYDPMILGWDRKFITLPPAAEGQAAVYLCFVFVSDWGNDVYIDNLIVSAPTGAAPPAVDICAGDVTADGDIEGGTFTLNSVTITDWPEGRTEWDTLWTPGHVLEDTIVAMSQFKVFGELIADSIQAAGDVIDMDDNVRVNGDVVATDSVIATNVYASNNINANTSMTLNGVTITAWPGGGVTGSLDGAYDYLTPGGGRVILADAGPVFIDATAGDTAIHCVSASSIDPTAFFQNTGGGYAIETIGDIMVHGVIHTDVTVSTPVITNLLGDTVWVDSKLYANEFVADTIEAREDYTVFKNAIWVADSIWMDGAWHTSWGGGGVANIDTLWMASGLTTDTMVAMAQFKVYGELIADSIQADGDLITLDDNVYVDGNIEVEDSIKFDYDAYIYYGYGSEGYGMYYSPDPTSSYEEHNFMIGGELAVQIYNHGLQTTYLDVDTIYGNTASPIIDDNLAITGDLNVSGDITGQSNLQIDSCATFGGGSAPITSVLSEGFETAVPPTGWTSNILTGSTDWDQDGTDSHSGSYSASFSTSSYGNSAELYTASMDISALTTPMLSFWHLQEDWYGDQDSLQVYYRTSAAGSWTLLASYTSSIDAWTQEVLSLPSPSADYWVRFVAYGEYGYGVFLDDVEVYETTGPAPAAVNICSGNITADGDLTVGNDATVHGKLTVDGLIDPTGLVLDPQASNPIGSGSKGIYVGTDDKLYYYNGTTTADISGGGGGASSLQAAYDGGNTIVTTGGNAVSITAGTGTALYVDSPDANGIWNDAGYWAPDGNVSLGTGSFHTNSGIYQSNGDFVAKIDADDDETNAKFAVRNSGDTDVFTIEEDGSGLLTGNTNDTLLVLSNLVGAGDVVGQYIEVNNASTDAADEAAGLVIDAVANGSIATGIKSMAEGFADDAWGGYFSGTHHGAANAGGVQATAFNDGSGMATGTFTEGTCASGNTLGDAYGLQSRGTIFEVTSTGDAYGGYFDAQNSGTGIEYGIYAKTTTVAGNWAGWFEGNVNISNILVSGGGIVLGGVYRTSWPSGGTVDFDTINATRHDTVVVSEALKVVGELIADSIQAVGTVIDMDDDVNVIGAVSLGGDSTFRTDWEPQDVITVGGANADFTSLDDAIAAATAGTNTLIDIAPGDYVVTGAPTLGSSIHLRGSGPSTTRINGALTIEGYAFHLTFYGGAATFNGATASECNFEDDVTAAGASFGFCNFNGDPSVSSISIADYTVFHDCEINMSANASGACKVMGCTITQLFTVTGGVGVGVGEFTGNLFMGGAISANDAEIYAEANLFKNDIEGGSGWTGITVWSGRAEIKANHFVDRAPGAIIMNDAVATILSNDILWCGSEGEAAILVRSVFGSFEVNIIGNHIDGTDTPITVPGIVLTGDTGCHGLIKDNVVERYNDGVVVSGMNLDMPDGMAIDNNVIYRNMNDGLRLGTGNYLVVHNDLYANNLSGGAGVDLNDGGAANLVVSHNVVDTYSSLSSPVPGALNTMSIGNLWAGAPQVGQLP